MKQKHLIWALVWVACFGSGCSSTTKGTGLPEDAGPHRGGKPAANAMRSGEGSGGGSKDAAVDSPEDGGGGSDLDGASGTTGGAGGVGGVDGSNTGGTGGCELVTHDNGLGQTWQDCVPLYTFNLDQALKACEASSATACFGTERCGVGEVRGLIGDAGAFFAEWGYEGFAAGLVAPDYNLCGGSSGPGIQRWR